VNDDTPIVFLDMDGVLVTRSSWRSAAVQRAKERQNVLVRAGRWVPRNPAYASYHRTMLHRPCIEQLDRLCAEAGASVVVSSSWRHAYWPEMCDWLRAAGLTAPVIDRTPVIPLRYGSRIEVSPPRGAEIASWRASAGHVGPYVVLDDDSDAGVGHEDRLVLCDFEHGLTAERADAALAVLRRST
jgi:hypothetical protein